MTIQEKLHEDMLVQSRAGNAIRRDNIKFLLGLFQNAAKNKEKTVSDDVAKSTIKKLLKSTTDLTIPTILKDPSRGEGCIAYKEAVDFVELCSDILPKEADESEILSFLETIDFSIFKSPMQAVGVVVKHFEGNVDGTVVKSLIEKMKK